MSVHTWCCGFGEQFLRDTADLIDDDGLTARVLPLVDGYARAFAAEQLRDAAEQLLWVTAATETEVVSVRDLYAVADQLDGGRG